MIIRRKKTDNSEQSQTITQEQPLVQPQVEREEFDFEKIEVKEREERRKGNRRRGYRRIDDRNLVSRAQEEAISIKERARQDGLKQGIADAKSELSCFKDALDEYFAYKNKVFDIVSRDILSIALDISKKIIKKETEIDKTILLKLIVEVISTTVKNENKITLKVAPKDVEYVKNNVPKILNTLQSEAKIFVVQDEKIEDGGVFVETANGLVDATFKTQLEILTEALIKT